jgi:hypothetical protein
MCPYTEQMFIDVAASLFWLANYHSRPQYGTLIEDEI